ncbi:hypothetical protein [Sporocytophaga myxococcoides]|nr:hypothetical protein [Sporocytophaga myxococcoides]
MKILWTISCLFFSVLSYASQLPEWARKDFERKGLKDKFELADYLRPAYLEADLNGDMRNDIAILVIEKQTGNKGLLILHQGDPNVYILGAGSTFGDGGNDFVKMNSWKIVNDVSIRRNNRIKTGIEVNFTDMSPAVIIFDGKEYNWQVQEG